MSMYTTMLNENAQISQNPFQLELMACYALKSDWNECVKYAELLRARRQQSAIATYILAMFKYVLSEQTFDPHLKEEASDLMKYIHHILINLIMCCAFDIGLSPGYESETLVRLLPRRRWRLLTQRNTSETASS